MAVHAHSLLPRTSIQNNYGANEGPISICVSGLGYSKGERTQPGVKRPRAKGEGMYERGGDDRSFPSVSTLLPPFLPESEAPEHFR